MNSEYLFVYGTLQKNSGNEMSKFLAKHSEFIGEGYFHGKLFIVSWYPGAILSDNNLDYVFGSVFKINKPLEVFKILDDYEGIGENYPKPHLFKKELTTIFLQKNTKIKAWVYLYNCSTKNLKQIASGDFFKQ